MPASELHPNHPSDVGAADRTGEAPSLASRVLWTFTAPRRLFAGFGERTPWFDVLALSTAVAMLAAATLPDEFYLERMEEPANRLGRPVEITSSPAEIVRWGRVLQAFSALAQHPMVALALGGLLALLFTVLGRGRVPFWRWVAVASHALLIPAAGVVAALGLRALTGDPWAQPTLGRLLQPVGLGPERAPFLDALDLFSLWMLLVLAVAVATLERRASWARPAAILVGLYLLLAAVSTLLLPA